MPRPNVPRTSEESRRLITTVARQRFAADGYAKATIRAIAADAGIDPSMVMRYFGNKEGLFAAVADFDLRLPDLADTPAATAGAVLAAHFLDRWEQDETFTALLHAAVGHQAARERLHAVISGPDLIGAVARLAPEPESVPVRVGMIAGQVLGAALCRYILRLPPLADMPRAELVAWLGGSIQRYLTEPLPA